MRPPDAACLRSFKKVGSVSQHKPFVWTSYWKGLEWAQKLGGVGSQEITRVGWTVLSRLMETNIWHLPVGQRLCRGTMASAITSLWEKAATSALVLKSDNSVSPCTSLTTFELQCQYWSSEWVTLSKSVCRPFRKNECLRLQQTSVSLSHTPHWFSQPELNPLLFLALEIWAGGLMWGWDHLFLGGDLHRWYIPPNF